MKFIVFRALQFGSWTKGVKVQQSVEVQFTAVDSSSQLLPTQITSPVYINPFIHGDLNPLLFGCRIWLGFDFLKVGRS